MIWFGNINQGRQVGGERTWARRDTFKDTSPKNTKDVTMMKPCGQLQKRGLEPSHEWFYQTFSWWILGKKNILLHLWNFNLAYVLFKLLIFYIYRKWLYAKNSKGYWSKVHSRKWSHSIMTMDLCENHSNFNAKSSSFMYCSLLSVFLGWSVMGDNICFKWELLTVLWLNLFRQINVFG